MKKLMLVIAVAIISGCAVSSPGTEIQVSEGLGSADVKLVKLSDGTKCAILVGYNKSSIACDWK